MFQSTWTVWIDIREITHLTSREFLNIRAALFVDDPDEIIQAAYHTAIESFTLGDVDGILARFKNKARLFRGMLGEVT